MIQGAKEKLGKIVEEGKQNITSILTQIQKEFEMRRDVIAKPSVIDYEVDGDISLILQGEKLGLTRHSRNQLWGRTQIPSTYGDRLLELGETTLLKKNLKTMTNRLNTEGVLFRIVGNLAKGILSPSYRRMDASPIFESFIQTAVDNKFVPYKAHNTEYRYQIQFLYPDIFQLNPDEYVVYGVSLTTGDYGSQALDVELLVLRITCKNLAVGYDLMRKVHLGKRFKFEGDEEAVSLSDKTHQLDSQTVASAVSDITKSSIMHIEHVDRIIRDSIGKEVSVPDVLKGLRSRKGLSKEISDKIQNTYDMATPVELLPSQKGLWRLSNAISLIAGGLENEDKQINTQKLAMDVLVEV